MERETTATLESRLRKALTAGYPLEDLHTYRVDQHAFTIYVGGDPHDEGDSEETRGVEPGVTHHMADRFEINLGFLSRLNPRRPILIQMASCGGNWEEGMQMFSAILHCQNPITVLATKWARSMTSLIPLAADRFVIRAPATYMFHHGTTDFSGLAGEEVDTFKEEVDKAKHMMLAVYIARLREQGKFKKYSTKRIHEMLQDKMRRKIDVWLSADDAVKWGFADAVFDGNAAALRTREVNLGRRERMMAVLRAPA
jgi:ATP-dependent protease ClpP protease subunit